MRIRVFYISLAIWYRVLLYHYSLYLYIHDKNQNYVYKIVLFCALRLCSVLCCTGVVLFCVCCMIVVSVFCIVEVYVCEVVLSCSVYSVFCSVLCYLVCAAYCCVLYSVSVYVCILYLFCVCACVCIVCVLCVYCVCVYVHLVCVREVPVEVSTQSDTPHVGYLCGYMVRIIKYKKTQPLIKLKSI